MRLSEEMKSLADHNFKKLSDDLALRYAGCTNVDEISFHMMMEKERTIYYRNFLLWAEDRARARIDTYVDVFRRANFIPNEGDIGEVCREIENILVNLSPEMPSEVQMFLRQDASKIINSARLELRIFASEMKFEQLSAAPPSTINYTANIESNFGGIQQGGEGNVQNITQTDESEDYQYYKERFSCPHCGAEATTLVNNDDVDYTEYACGYAYGGNYNNPCPHDPEFPTLDEYEMEIRGKDNRWYCHPKPKTKAARKLTLDVSSAETPEEAKARVAKQYDFRARNVPKNKKPTN